MKMKFHPANLPVRDLLRLPPAHLPAEGHHRRRGRQSTRRQSVAVELLAARAHHPAAGRRRGPAVGEGGAADLRATHPLRPIGAWLTGAQRELVPLGSRPIPAGFPHVLSSSSDFPIGN